MRRLKSRIGWQRVGWKSPVLTLPAGMEIDLGGIGKEYAVDRAAMLAQSSGRCLVNFGGDLRVTGTGVDGEGWLVGVEGVGGRNLPVKRIQLMRGALATSGDAHRFLLKNGRRYSHILNPRTGWPVDGAPRSVTVAAPSCTQAGMLATLAMLRGTGAEAVSRRAGRGSLVHQMTAGGPHPGARRVRAGLSSAAASRLRCAVERLRGGAAQFSSLDAASISACVSVPEQISGMIWSNGASSSVWVGTFHGSVSTFGS